MMAGLCGRELLEEWHTFVLEMSQRFGAADPLKRVKWAGPDMSVRSSITARLMETWAHGLAIYDALGVERVDSDRIRNIVVLGVNTFGWTFKNQVSGLHYIAALGKLQCHASVLLHQQDGRTLLIDIFEGIEHFHHQQRGETH